LGSGQRVKGREGNFATGGKKSPHSGRIWKRNEEWQGGGFEKRGEGSKGCTKERDILTGERITGRRKLRKKRTHLNRGNAWIEKGKIKPNELNRGNSEKKERVAVERGGSGKCPWAGDERGVVWGGGLGKIGLRRSSTTLGGGEYSFGGGKGLDAMGKKKGQDESRRNEGEEPSAETKFSMGRQEEI